MKLYFVGYKESRKELEIMTSEVMVIKISFSKGVNISRHSGHRLKRDALARIERVNRAAGKEIAYYHGPEIV